MWGHLRLTKRGHAKLFRVFKTTTKLKIFYKKFCFYHYNLLSVKSASFCHFQLTASQLMCVNILWLNPKTLSVRVRSYVNCVFTVSLGWVICLQQIATFSVTDPRLCIYVMLCRLTQEKAVPAAASSQRKHGPGGARRAPHRPYPVHRPHQGHSLPHPSPSLAPINAPTFPRQVSLIPSPANAAWPWTFSAAVSPSPPPPPYWLHKRAPSHLSCPRLMLLHCVSHRRFLSIRRWSL